MKLEFAIDKLTFAAGTTNEAIAQGVKGTFDGKVEEFVAAIKELTSIEPVQVKKEEGTNKVQEEIKPKKAAQERKAEPNKVMIKLDQPMYNKGLSDIQLTVNSDTYRILTFDQDKLISLINGDCSKFNVIDFLNEIQVVKINKDHTTEILDFFDMMLLFDSVSKMKKQKTIVK